MENNTIKELARRIEDNENVVIIDLTNTFNGFTEELANDYAISNVEVLTIEDEAQLDKLTVESTDFVLVVPTEEGELTSKVVEGLSVESVIVDSSLEELFLEAATEAGRVYNGCLVYKRLNDEYTKDQMVNDIMTTLGKCVGCVTDYLNESDWNPELAVTMILTDLHKTDAIAKLVEVKGNLNKLN